MNPGRFRHRIERSPGARFAPEAGRYHLYVMYGCPWAHRTIIVRELKGLQGIVGMTAMHHRLIESEGWTFAPERPDPLYGARRLRELYEMADPAYDAKATVPMLWDKKERTIVNNESADIVRMFGSVFDDDTRPHGPDLYPAPLRPEIDRWNTLIQDAVNEGAYAAAFAVDQASYEQAARRFFQALDTIEQHLSRQRFLAGSQPTEADWRLFPTLLRLEWVYSGLFKLNLRRLVDYPHLYAYTRELYQWPGVAATVNERHIRDGYWPSLTRLNPTGFVPIGPELDLLAPPRRESLAVPLAA